MTRERAGSNARKGPLLELRDFERGYRRDFFYPVAAETIVRRVDCVGNGAGRGGKRQLRCALPTDWLRQQEKSKKRKKKNIRERSRVGQPWEAAGRGSACPPLCTERRLLVPHRPRRSKTPLLCTILKTTGRLPAVNLL